MKLLLVFFLLLQGFARAGTLGFASMEDGDRIEVTLHSEGCFHNTTSYYEVRKDKGAHVFTEYAITWKRGVALEIADKKVLGRLTLTPKEVAGLDALLNYYRGKKNGNSTTQVDLVVEYYEPGRKVGVEKLFDLTGGFELNSRTDLVTFRALSRRMEDLRKQAGRP